MQENGALMPSSMEKNVAEVIVPFYVVMKKSPRVHGVDRMSSCDLFHCNQEGIW